MRGIVVQDPGNAQVVDSLPRPKLRDDYIIVEVAAVALNPTDVGHIDSIPCKGALLGCDYAGTVVEVGPAVKKDLKKGDRVAGFVHGANSEQHEDGAYAEYIAAKGDLQMKIPDNISFEEAATIGVGFITTGQGLYQSLGLPLPTEPAKEKFPLLIYGGSTATGTVAIQFAKLSGLEVITTCSPHNFDLVKGLGADHVFDYKSPTCAADIRKVTNNKLKYVFDCISRDASPQICADSIGPEGGKYSALLGVPKFPRDDVYNVFNHAYTPAGEAFKKGPNEFTPKKEDFEFGVKFCALAEKLLAEGKIKPHSRELREGGLDGILEGVQDLREWKVSGAKLVYKLA
jgi:NADPH:quinone reductase-like Zn-dependent oxidoreductase